MSNSFTQTKHSFQAGAAYFALVFTLGFLLGTVRMLILVPQLGEFYSYLIELPIILIVAWFICRWLVNCFTLDDRWPSRVLMGVTAFALLMMAELVLSMTLFDRSFHQHIAFYRTPYAMLGLAGQVAFAVFPMLMRRSRSWQQLETSDRDSPTNSDTV